MSQQGMEFGETPCMPKVRTFSFHWISPPPKTWVSLSPDYQPHIEKKKVSLIVFRQILSKILPEACIFSNTIMIYSKILLELNPLIQNSVQQDYLPELHPIIPINIYRKPWRWGIIPPNSQKCTHFPHQKNLL